MPFMFKLDKSKMTDYLFNYVQNSFIENIIEYIIDWSNKKNSVRLTKWLNPQIGIDIDVDLTEIPDSTDYDEQVIHCLRWVRNHLTYIGDVVQWKITEKWSTAQETATRRMGDCEDGAILAYVLCRMKGVPANRLLLMAGDVQDPNNENNTVGHCWLAYRPIQCPLNYVFLDWCYYYHNAGIYDGRNFYYIDGQRIFLDNEYERIHYELTAYKNLWFAFNEEHNYRELNYTGGMIE